MPYPGILDARCIWAAGIGSMFSAAAGAIRRLRRRRSSCPPVGRTDLRGGMPPLAPLRVELRRRPGTAAAAISALSSSSLQRPLRGLRSDGLRQRPSARDAGTAAELDSSLRPSSRTSRPVTRPPRALPDLAAPDLAAPDLAAMRGPSLSAVFVGLTNYETRTTLTASYRFLCNFCLPIGLDRLPHVRTKVVSEHCFTT